LCGFTPRGGYFAESLKCNPSYDYAKEYEKTCDQVLGRSIGSMFFVCSVRSLLRLNLLRQFVFQ
jgi:hypothetical protein